MPAPPPNAEIAFSSQAVLDEEKVGFLFNNSLAARHVGAGKAGLI